jgi:hypothetical protein
MVMTCSVVNLTTETNRDAGLGVGLSLEVSSQYEYLQTRPVLVDQSVKDPLTGLGYVPHDRQSLSWETRHFPFGYLVIEWSSSSRPVAYHEQVADGYFLC